ncbi:MAG: tetratricopeptide repeat protein [Candidatus Wallbacteria bacterium]|nr:tetratricopeptide repeat protein [Candidatus Wallbacteria bacterium]
MNKILLLLILLHFTIILPAMPSNLTNVLITSGIQAPELTITDKRPGKDLQSLTGLINGSFWTMRLSQQLSAGIDKESVEQVYVSSLDEIERESTVIAENIVSQLLLGNEASFRKFTDCFRDSENTVKNGMGVLATKLEEKISQNQQFVNSHPEIITKIKEIVVEVGNAHVDFGQNPKMTEMIDKYGVSAAGFQSGALTELLETGKRDEYDEKLPYFKKSFALYSELNFKDCPKSTVENTADFYAKALKSFSAASYKEAAGLFAEVQKLDPVYAAKVGCYSLIGDCYRELKQYSEAIDFYRQSIDRDGRKPYRMHAMASGVSIYIRLLPDSIENGLKAIEFLNAAIRRGTVQEDEAVWTPVQLQAGSYYNLSWKETDPAKKISYFLLGIELEVKFVDQYPANQFAHGALYDAAYGYCDDYLHKLLAYQNEAREQYYLKAVEVFTRMKDVYHSYALDRWTDIGTCYLKIGYMEYLDPAKSHTFVLQKKADYCLKAVAAFQNNLLSYYGGLEARQNIARSYSRAAECYEDQDNIQEVEHYYKESIASWTDAIGLSQGAGIALANLYIGDNYTKLVRDYSGINGSQDKQREYADKAVSALKQVIDNESYGMDMIAIGMGCSGDALRYLKDYDNAISWYDKVIDKYGSNSAANNYLAYSLLFKGDCLVEQGKYADGKAACQKFNDLGLARDTSDNAPHYELLLGKCEYGLQHYSEALSHLDKALNSDIYPDYEVFRAEAYLYRGKCNAEQGRYSEAQQDFAKVVGSYCNDRWWFYDIVVNSKDCLSEILKVKIDESTPQSEPRTFTASLTYPDDTPALIPTSSIREWKWEESGNVGDGHVFTWKDNTAKYKSGTGDFLDTILTAKCRIDARFGVLRGISSEIWLEGDNQAPVSLVNELGQRLARIPIYCPNSGIDKGESPYNNQIELSINFKTDFSIDVTDEIQMCFLDENGMDVRDIYLNETQKDSRDFVSEDSKFEVKLESPTPLDSKDVSYFKPGQNLMKFSLKLSDDTIMMQIPIWRAPTKNRKDLYFASNIFFERGTCGFEDQEQFIPTNSKFFVKIIDKSNSPSVFVKLKSSIDSVDKIECTRVRKNSFLSEPFYLVPQDFGNKKITISGKEYSVLKGNPALGGIDQKDIGVEYQFSDVISKSGSKTLFDRFFTQSKGNAYATRALSGAQYWQCFFALPKYILTYFKIKDLNYSVVGDASATLDEFKEDFIKNKFSIFYFLGHGIKTIYPNGKYEFSGICMYKNYNQVQGIGTGRPDTLEISDIPSGTKCPFVFLNACHTGVAEGKRDDYIKAFGANVYVGWTFNQVPSFAMRFGNSFFYFCKKQKGVSEAPSITQAAKEGIKDITGEEDLGKYHLYIGGPGDPSKIKLDQ